MLSAEQVEEAILFLLSDNSQAINGENLVVDDGWNLWNENNEMVWKD